MKRKNKFLVSLLVFLLIFNTSIFGQDSLAGLRSYLLADYESGEILEGHNLDEPVEIASISKIMTYLVVRDAIDKGLISMDDKIIIDEEVAKIGGSSMKLEEGEVFTVDELLDSIIVISANDSASALARHLASSDYNFSLLMNKKAREIGLDSGFFYNPSGLPVYGQEEQNVMSTRDILKMVRYTIDKYPDILETMKLSKISIPKRSFQRNNTNPLLGMIGVDGFKTGFTNKAGYCNISTFTSYGRNNSLDNRFITIVMGAKSLEDRQDKSLILYDRARTNYRLEKVLDKDLPLGRVETAKVKGASFYFYPIDDFNYLRKLDKDWLIEKDLDKDLAYPLKSGQSIGQVRVKEDGEIIFISQLIVKEDIEKASFLDKLVYYFKGIINK